MLKIDDKVTNILQNKDLVLKVAELVLAVLVFLGVAYFSVVALGLLCVS